MKNILNVSKRVFIGLIAMLAMGGATVPLVKTTYAEGFSGTTTTLSLSPMYEKLVLTPGETYSGNLTVSSPANAVTDLSYKVYVQNYYRDEDNNAIFEDVDETGQMVNWITITSPLTGTLKPNETSKIQYTINVPNDAPAGGQYAAITVGTLSQGSVGGDNASIAIQESVAIAYTIYAEIAGNTVRKGEIYDLNLPSFLFSGEITGSAMVKNLGNVHDDATFTLQVFPLFSGEEIYTNEENPDTRLVLPNRTLYFESSWANTPMVGIFNVIYTVEFEGVTSQISKMVIVCPLWLLFIIFFIIASLIIWLVVRIRSRKKTEKQENGE